MTMQLEPLAQSILDFWFGPMEQGRLLEPHRQSKWFKKDEQFDKSIRSRFQEYIDPACMGALDRWTLHDEGLAALIVLLDQFPRNMFRGEARAFAYDKKALSLTMLALHEQRFRRLPAVMAYFCLLPTMHAENIEVQDLGVAAFSQLLDRTAGADRSLIETALDYAKAHRNIIARFGYFPHRNSIVGRQSSPEDLAFLQEPGSSF